MKFASTPQYSYVSEVDVWLDVLGVKKAPPGERPPWLGQHLPLGLDGLPVMEGVRAQMDKAWPGIRRDAFGAPVLPRMSELIASTDVPVYGIVDNPHGLQLGSLYGGPGRQGSWSTARITSLIFMNNPQVDDPPDRTAEYLYSVLQEQMQWNKEDVRSIIRLDIGSSESADESKPRRSPPVPTRSFKIGSSYGLAYDAPRSCPHGRWQHSFFPTDFAIPLYNSLDNQIRGRLTDQYAQFLCKQAEIILRSGLPDLVGEVAAGKVQLLQLRLMIEGREFWGDVLYWDARIPVSVFRLEHILAQPVLLSLQGSSYGIEQADVVKLLEQLVVTNDRPDLLAQYDMHFAERLERFRKYNS